MVKVVDPNTARYTTNKALGVRRPPTAFALFLNAWHGKVRAYKQRRLRTKTTVFRMDLLRQKFASLEDAVRQGYVARAHEALQKSREQRKQLLESSDPPAQRPAVAGPGVKDNVDSSAVAEPLVSLSPDSARITWTDKASGLSKHYIMGAELGRGVFGVCRRARDVVTGELLCVKMPTSEPTAGIALRDECWLMRKCEHPNVMRPIGMLLTGSVGTAMFLPLMSYSLMECIQRRSLLPAVAGNKDQISLVPAVAGNKDQFVSWQRSVLVQIAAGLAHMHCQRILHLDMKPHSVLVLEQEHCLIARISDLGNAQGMPSTCQADNINAEQYRPFELFEIEGKVALMPRFDLWAFGCLVFDVSEGAPLISLAVIGGSQTRMWRSYDERLRNARGDAVFLLRRLCPRSRASKDQLGMAALSAMLRGLRVRDA
jgi:hypothetical protein